MGNEPEKVTLNRFPLPRLGANSKGGLAVGFRRRPQSSDLQTQGPTRESAGPVCSGGGSSLTSDMHFSLELSSAATLAETCPQAAKVPVFKDASLRPLSSEPGSPSAPPSSVQTS